MLTCVFQHVSLHVSHCYENIPTNSTLRMQSCAVWSHAVHSSGQADRTGEGEEGVGEREGGYFRWEQVVGLTFISHYLLHEFSVSQEIQWFPTRPDWSIMN